ncbi:hypothetical protein ACFL2Q_13405 [Thermodesulfobacteriota bacterium]
MIVLDEQLLGRGIDEEISLWYRGSVVFVRDLRPNTLVKDDAIPQLLQKERQPAFVTINAKDFWRKVPADKRFCMVCFPIRDRDVPEIPTLLRNLFTREGFQTKAGRSGHIFRVTLEGRVRFYRWDGTPEYDLML